MFDGDLAVAGTRDLFSQRTFDGLSLTSLGAASVTDPLGFSLQGEGIYDEVALFLSQDLGADLFGVKLEGGAPPHMVDPLPDDYAIADRGTKVVFYWGSSVFPCQFHEFPDFAILGTTPGTATCFGTHALEVYIGGWKVSSDGIWLTYDMNWENSSIGSRLYARHLPSNQEVTLDTDTLEAGFGPIIPRVREDGLALVHPDAKPPLPQSGFEVVAWRIGSPVRTLASGLLGPTGILFSDQGELVVIIGRRGTSTYELSVASLISGVTTIIDSDAVPGIDAARFVPDESLFAFTDVSSVQLFVSPTTTSGA
ncbi:MAG: hypothetical protein GY708_25205, partial [Actinomycetia bacterium]|nr:hypothetical protein [Actinomycetes bacterium]